MITAKAKVILQQVTRDRVLELTEIEELTYMEMLVDNGLEYLMKLGNYTEEKAILIGEQTMYWAWWSNQWNRIDRLFLAKYSRSGFSKQWLRKRYAEAHDPDFIDVFPHAIVMQLKLKP